MSPPALGEVLIERHRLLDRHRTPRRRRSFMNRGQLDAPDIDLHFGGAAVGGMPIRARCSCGACGRRRRKRGRRDEARCRRNQGRRCEHTSRINKRCRPEDRGLSHRGRCRILIRGFAHRVRGAQLVACVKSSARQGEGRRRTGRFRFAKRGLEYRGHGGMVRAWKRGRRATGHSRFADRRLACCVRRGRGRDPRSGRGRGCFIARRLLEYRGHGGIGEPGRGFHRNAEPKRLSREAA